MIADRIDFDELIMAQLGADLWFLKDWSDGAGNYDSVAQGSLLVWFLFSFFMVGGNVYSLRAQVRADELQIILHDTGLTLHLSCFLYCEVGFAFSANRYPYCDSDNQDGNNPDDDIAIDVSGCFGVTATGLRGLRFVYVVL